MKAQHILLLSALTLFGCQNKQTFDATGFFEATPVTISAEVSGKILQLPVEEGDSVVVDQEIALIDTTLLSLQARQLSFQRQSAASIAPDIRKQAAALREQIAHAEQESARIERLLAAGAATQKNYDDSRAQVATLRAQLSALTASLENNRSASADNSDAIAYQIKQIEEQISRCKLKAPIAATVMTKYAQAGEFIAAGRPLVQLANLNDIFLRSYFTASQLADIKLGQEVTVIADFGTDKKYEYPGRITWISQESEFTPKAIQTDDSRANLVYAVKIAVRNDGRLKLGQYGEVRL